MSRLSAKSPSSPHAQPARLQQNSRERLQEQTKCLGIVPLNGAFVAQRKVLTSSVWTLGQSPDGVRAQPRLTISAQATPVQDGSHNRSNFPARWLRTDDEPSDVLACRPGSQLISVRTRTRCRLARLLEQETGWSKICSRARRNAG